MPGRIIALYVILCLRCLTNATALVKALMLSSLAAKVTVTVAAADFAACLFMLIALYQRKTWLILLFRIYIAIVMPLTLVAMGVAAILKDRRGEMFAWNAFSGGVIAAVGFFAFAWYVGCGPTRRYLGIQVASAEPPLLEAGKTPNQAPDPTSTVGGFDHDR